MTHGNANTFPLPRPGRSATSRRTRSSPAAEAVIKLFRDHGNRGRPQAGPHQVRRPRLGRREVPRGAGRRTCPSRSCCRSTSRSPASRCTSAGTRRATASASTASSVENGRIKDEGDFRLRTALRTLVEKFQPSIRLTPLQDILLCDLPKSAQADDRADADEHGVAGPSSISLVQKHSMACPAIPTCGLAISEAERALPGIIDQLEAELQRLGLDNEKIGVRMTGCPNGCARPYQSDIGIVGR